MPATRLTGALRPDDLIELTGTSPGFRAVSKATGLRLATLPVPGEAVPPARPAARLLRRVRDWSGQGPLRLALLTRADFEAHGLAAHVDFHAQAGQHGETAAMRAVGTLLKALLLDRRGDLSLDRMATEMESKLGVATTPDALQAMLAGHAPLTPDVLHAMLITLHAHKALTPGNVAEITLLLAASLGGYPLRQPDHGLLGLLKFPQAEIATAFYRKQIRVTEDGGVTLAGVTVTPDLTIFFNEPSEQAGKPARRPWKSKGDLRQIAHHAGQDVLQH